MNENEIYFTYTYDWQALWFANMNGDLANVKHVRYKSKAKETKYTAILIKLRKTRFK